MEVRTINMNNATSVGSVATIPSRGLGGGSIPPLFTSDPISRPATLKIDHVRVDEAVIELE